MGKWAESMLNISAYFLIILSNDLPKNLLDPTGSTSGKVWVSSDTFSTVLSWKPSNQLTNCLAAMGDLGYEWNLKQLNVKVSNFLSIL